MVKRTPAEDETPQPITAKQTGSYAMAEAKRVFLREFASKARVMARVLPTGDRRAALLAYSERCSALALHFERWTGPVLVGGVVHAARRDDATERAPDLAAYAQCISDAKALGVRF